MEINQLNGIAVLQERHPDLNIDELLQLRNLYIDDLLADTAEDPILQSVEQHTKQTMGKHYNRAQRRKMKKNAHRTL